MYHASAHFIMQSNESVLKAATAPCTRHLALGHTRAVISARDPCVARHGHLKQVVSARPDQVPPDRAEERACEVQRRHDVEQIRLHQDDVGRIDRNQCARRERDADRSCGERGRVVDAIFDLAFRGT
jgi:hypothetical protein